MNSSPTQQFIDIAGIKDGVVITTSGGYRMIFSVAATNFSLKSEEEQNSIVFQYQSFLNSLHFPIEVVMRSKKLDLNPYIKRLEALKEKQGNDLLRVQMEDYIDFIGELINMANIMKKTFYVVVPYDPAVIKKPSVLGSIFPAKGMSNVRVSEAEFNRYKSQLVERSNTVASGLGSMGLHCVQMTTEQIIELFYQIYNPDVADVERYTSSVELTSDLVAKAPVEGQPEGEKITREKQAEEIIDNSALVADQQKKMARDKQIEAYKEAGASQTQAPTSQAPTPNAPQESSKQIDQGVGGVTNKAPAVLEPEAQAMNQPAPPVPPAPPATVPIDLTKDDIGPQQPKN